jgi:hypothetical protein
LPEKWKAEIFRLCSAKEAGDVVAADKADQEKKALRAYLEWECDELKRGHLLPDGRRRAARARRRTSSSCETCPVLKERQGSCRRAISRALETCSISWRGGWWWIFGSRRWCSNRSVANDGGRRGAPTDQLDLIYAARVPVSLP